MARSMGGALMAWPQLERAPLIHWMAERSNENVSRQRSQAMVDTKKKWRGETRRSGYARLVDNFDGFYDKLAQLTLCRM